jgi:hypothetical protein
MSQARRDLMLVDWRSVRMLSLQRECIHILTEDGPKTFSFGSESEARSAFEVWIKRPNFSPLDHKKPAP